ncbi:MAG: hypothetical protein NZP34_04840 [Caldilineales bacterium]|nr:hypothetical protein [Caldilineales bacterium]
MLTQCLLTLADRHNVPEDLRAALVRELVPRLIAPSGIRRYKRWRRQHTTEANTEPDYCAWLEQVVAGYLRYRPTLQNGRETADGVVPDVTTLIGAMVDRYCRKINFVPDAELRRDFVHEIVLSLLESYLYDTELEAWLRNTTRNHIRRAARRWRRRKETPLGEHVAGFDTAQLEWTTTFADILTGIRRIKNRRHRVILLLILLYRLDAVQLAAFFGVPIDTMYTWCSQARDDLRRCMNAPQG